MQTPTKNRECRPPDPPPDVRMVHGISSEVELQQSQHRAVKVYHRHPLIGALYRIVFQAPFPYVKSRAALKAAKYRRRIAGLVTKFFLGRDVVAPVVAVERNGDGFAFVTELIDGSEPKNHRRARAFLHDVTRAFIETGLPTWQVTPFNPRSLGNVMEIPGGDYRIIDLESNVVTPMLPLSGVWAAARDAHLPPFDDIDTTRLLTWIEKNRDEIERRLGEEGAQQLIEATAGYVWYERLWQGSELRLWSRALRVLTRILDIPAHLRAIGHKISGWQEKAPRGEGWLQDGLARWQDEGRITAAEAHAAAKDLEETQTLTVLAHLGAHLTMSIPLRFPLGAIARFSYTVFFRLRAEARVLIKRRMDDETSSARATHSFLVMAAAAMPGLGSGAYVLASPLRRNRILLAVAMDQAFRLLPFGLYGRLHLSGVTYAISTGTDRNGTQVQVRPHEVRADTAKLMRSLGPYRKILSLLLVIPIAALLGALGYYALTGSLAGFDEFGPVSSLKVVASILAAIVGVGFYRAFWRQPMAETRPGAATSLFWPIAGLAMAWVAVDDYLQIHEATLDDFAGIPVIEHLEALVIVAYFVIGVALVTLFERELRSSEPVFLLTAIGLFFVVATFAFDSLVPGDGTVMAIEESAHLCAATALLAAFIVRVRQLEGSP